MIRITNIRNIGLNYDEVWAIVRKMKGSSSAIRQITGLSPSPDLFFKYRSLEKEGNWNADTFRSVYLPQFLKEIYESKEARFLLNQLYLRDKQERNVCLVCFCADETLCHRSIVAGLLQGVGCNVVTDTDNDYTEYYQMFLNLKGKE